jgi:hypothetical protein
MVLVALGVAMIWFVAVRSDSSGRTDPPAPELPSPAAPVPQPASAAPNPQPATPPEKPQPATHTQAPTLNEQASDRGSPSGIKPPERSGPVDELKQSFASEPRASAAVSVESAISAAFQRPEVPQGLLKSVLCRSTVCRVETRWSPDRAAGFMVALMQLVTQPPNDQPAFDHNLGISPEAEPNADGNHAIDVYLKQLPSAKPAADRPTP